MKIFFDTEFTGLTKNTTLISIGLVTENINGKDDSFYAEFTDYDRTMVDDWINKNVIQNLVTYKSYYVSSVNNNKIPIHENDKEFFNKKYKVHLGNKNEISKLLKKWLSKFDSVELVSDCCHYDMVLFIDLFGSAFDLPSNVCPTCYDINQDISRHFNISNTKAFDVSREQILDDNDINLNMSMKHNSLYDAFVIRELYYLLNK